MKDLAINITSKVIYFPVINFNYKTGTCEISGESYMEETRKFYEPVISWLKNYILEKRPVVFYIKVTYLDTSSSGYMLEILNLLKKHEDLGNDVKVSWYYHKDDSDMLGEINDFIRESGLKIRTLPFDFPRNINTVK